MGDTLVEITSPHRHGAVDKGAGAGWADYPLRPIAALVPARHHELEEVDQMVAVQMGQHQGIDVAPGQPGLDQPVGDAGAAVDQHMAAAMLTTWAGPWRPV